MLQTEVSTPKISTGNRGVTILITTKAPGTSRGKANEKWSKSKLLFGFSWCLCVLVVKFFF
jgi:hypothetical protein